MKYVYFILPILLFSISCNTSNQAEKDYIKNLEEKNQLLEKEITDLKNDSGNNSPDKSNLKNKKGDYFTIGSSEKKVLEVMGNPTGYEDMAPIGKVMRFGASSVDFKNGKVISYSNLKGNLKVKVTE